MTRYVAFLRAINAGVPAQMSQLRDCFEELGFDDVSTVINSGNVLFTTKAGDASKLEAKIERALKAVLGAAVPTFLRIDAEVVKLAGARPFDGVTSGLLQVGFLKSAPPAATKRKVAALSNDTDRLKVVGRELWWHVRGGFMDSTVKQKPLAAALGDALLTVRGVKTVQRIAKELA